MTDYPFGTWTMDEVIGILSQFRTDDTINLVEVMYEARTKGRAYVDTQHGITVIEWWGSQDYVNLYTLVTHARAPMLMADATEDGGA
jgi:hypothetical protein